MYTVLKISWSGGEIFNQTRWSNSQTDETEIPNLVNKIGLAKKVSSYQSFL